MMSSIEVAALAAALGAVMPLIVAVVVQSSWPRQLKASVALISCLLAGALAVLEAGLSPLDVALALPVLVATMEVTYRRYWKPTGIAPWIEMLTDLVRRPDEVGV